MKSLQLSKPHLLIVTGIVRSGKSSFAEKFADTFSAPFINAKLLGDQPNTSLATAYMVLEQLFKTKSTIVYEGVRGTRAERMEVARLSREHGYDPLFIWVQTDPSMAHMRATKPGKSNPNPLTSEAFDREVAGFTPLHPMEKASVISGMHTYASQAKVVLKRLSNEADRETNPIRSVERPKTDGPRRTGIIVR